MDGMGSFLGQGLTSGVLDPPAAPEEYTARVGLREPPRMIFCMESYRVCRLWVEAVSSSSSRIGYNRHKDKSGNVRSEGWAGRGWECSGEMQELPFLGNPKASVPGWHHASGTPTDNSVSIACCGHKEPRPFCPRRGKGGPRTSPHQPSLDPCFLAEGKPSPVSGETRASAALMGDFSFPLKQSFLRTQCNFPA